MLDMEHKEFKISPGKNWSFERLWSKLDLKVGMRSFLITHSKSKQHKHQDPDDYKNILVCLRMILFLKHESLTYKSYI